MGIFIRVEEEETGKLRWHLQAKPSRVMTKTPLCINKPCFKFETTDEKSQEFRQIKQLASEKALSASTEIQILPKVSDLYERVSNCLKQRIKLSETFKNEANPYLKTY